MTELELEQHAHRLEKQTLIRVFYQRARGIDEIRTNVESHSIEHRVVLELANGNRVAIDYSNELATRHGFGVALRDIKVIDSAFGRIDDVGRTPRWAPLLGNEISSSRIVWDDVGDRLRSGFKINLAIHADHLTRQDFPSALELAIGEARVLIAAARRSADGTIVPYANELLVSFR